MHVSTESTKPSRKSKPCETKYVASEDCKPSCVLWQTRGGSWKQEGSAVPVAAAAVLRGLALIQMRGIKVGKIMRLPISVESFRDWSWAVDAGKSQLRKTPVEALIRAIQVCCNQIWNPCNVHCDAESMHLVAASMCSRRTGHVASVCADVGQAETAYSS